MAKVLIVLACLVLGAWADSTDIPLVPGSPVEAVLTFDSESWWSSQVDFATPAAKTVRRLLQTAPAVPSIASPSGSLNDTSAIPELSALAEALATNISAALTGGNSRHLLEHCSSCFDVELTAKKSTLSDFALLDFDFSGKAVTAALVAAAGCNPIEWGPLKAYVTSSFLFIDAHPNYYGEYSTDFFGSRNVGDRSVKIGIQLPGKELDADTIKLGFTYNVFSTVGNYCWGELHVFYKVKDVSVRKWGLPTVSGIFDTFV